MLHNNRVCSYCAATENFDTMEQAPADWQAHVATLSATELDNFEALRSNPRDLDHYWSVLKKEGAEWAANWAAFVRPADTQLCR